MGEQITVVRGKRNVVLRSLENVENDLKNIAQNFDSRDLSLVDLEPKEYEVEYEKNLKREGIFFQVIARVERCLKQSR